MAEQVGAGRAGGGAGCTLQQSPADGEPAPAGARGALTRSIRAPADREGVPEAGGREHRVRGPARPVWAPLQRGSAIRRRLVACWRGWRARRGRPAGAGGPGAPRGRAAARPRPTRARPPPPHVRRFRKPAKKIPGKCGLRFYKNVGLGYKTPREAIEGEPPWGPGAPGGEGRGGTGDWRAYIWRGPRRRPRRRAGRAHRRRPPPAARCRPPPRA
jgi:hypothetical protein